MVRPRRLGDFDYLGPNAYFVTACTFNRIRWFADGGCARGASAQRLRTSSDYGFDLLAYCFMPDHLHALVAGVRADADFSKVHSDVQTAIGIRSRRKAQGAVMAGGVS